MANESVKFASN